MLFCDYIEPFCEIVLGYFSKLSPVFFPLFQEEPEKILRGISHLHHDGKEVTLFHVMDPAELHLPQTGLVDVTALETRQRLTADLAEIRDEYLRQLHLYLEELRHGCMNLRADYVLTETHKEIYEAILTRSR